MEVLTRQPWPGNIRQLENTIFRAVVLAEGAYLTAADFPLLAAEFEAAGIDNGPPMVTDEDVDLDEDGDYDAPPALLVDHGATVDAFEVFDRDGNLRSLQDIERDLIELAIDTYNGQMSEVARRLGMGRSTLYRKLRDHGLTVKRAS